MTKAEAKAITTMLALAAPNAAVPQETFDLYTAHLERFPFAYVKVAAERLVLTSKWFPAISELLAETVRVADRLPDPEEAWLAALRWQRANFDQGNRPHHAVLSAIKASGGTHAMRTAAAHDWKRVFDTAYRGEHKLAFQKLLDETLPAIEAETRKALAAGTALPAGLLPRTTGASS